MGREEDAAKAATRKAAVWEYWSVKHLNLLSAELRREGYTPVEIEEEKILSLTRYKNKFDRDWDKLQVLDRIETMLIKLSYQRSYVRALYDRLSDKSDRIQLYELEDHEELLKSLIAGGELTQARLEAEIRPFTEREKLTVTQAYDYAQQLKKRRLENHPEQLFESQTSLMSGGPENRLSLKERNDKPDTLPPSQRRRLGLTGPGSDSNS